jgi:hypothetical protein
MVVFASIADLPPFLRNRTSNLIKLFIIGASNPPLQSFFNQNQTELETLIRDGLTVSGVGHFALHLAGSISDSPQIAKVCNSNQYNGFFGCIHCMTSCVVLESGHHIYKYTANLRIRTNTVYKEQVQVSLRSRKKYQGIKGSC